MKVTFRRCASLRLAAGLLLSTGVLVLLTAGLAAGAEQAVQGIAQGGTTPPRVAQGGQGVHRVAPAEQTVQGVLLHQGLDLGQGLTVLRVWGSPYEMGFAQGYLLAEWIDRAGSQMKAAFRTDWAEVRKVVSGWTFMPPQADEEYEGLLDGLRAALPGTGLDILDLKAYGTFGDWSYRSACSSTSVWGESVEPPFTTLSVRKLQFAALPAEVTQQWHHVICARAPDDGFPDWVNLAFPGQIGSVTGVNEFGTVASLHDWNSSTGRNWINALPRTMACRWILSLDFRGDPSTHLRTALDTLHPFNAATGGFINYFVPNGGAGVIRSSKDQGFHSVRTPRPEYMGGAAISTNNSDISGADGIEPWDSYFRTLDPAAGRRATMGGLWDTAFSSSDMHILEVGFRARGDMTLYFTGRLQTGPLDRFEVEWRDLFGEPAPLPPADPERPAGVNRVRSASEPPVRRDEVTIQFELTDARSDTRPRLGIFDGSGRLVRTLTPSSTGPRQAVFRWDGRDEQGRGMETGTYTGRLIGRSEPARTVVLSE